MKRLSILCITMLSSICLLAAPYTAQIEHVTVFTYGAELQQRISLPLQAGDNTVVIENIAPNINEESLQIALGGGVIVRQYAFSLDYLNADKLKMNTAALEDSLKMAQDALADSERRITTLTQMQTLLQAGVNSSLTATTGVTTATIDKNLQYFRTNALDLAKQLDATKAEKANLEQRIKVLKQQIKEVRGKSVSKSGIVTLELNSPKKQTITAGIKYYTESAAWLATYDLNIRDLHSPVGLVMKAHVSQYTGLDWKNVKLTLSTGRPSSSNQAPELTTWWLQQQTMRARGVYAAKSVSMAVMADAAAEEEVEVYNTGLAPTNTIQKYVEQNEQALSVEYAISLPYTIQGNGKEQIISLLERQLDDVAYNYFAAPAMDESAYLVAYINGWQQQQLPDGRASLTYNGTYYGETMLATNNDEARVRLTLGDDKQIKIKREKTAHSSKTSGSTKVVTYSYTTTVRNDKSEQISITVKDRYPVSTAKEIQVSVDSKSTAATTDNKQTGMLTYELTIAPGESRQIVLTYTVKYPKDWTINL